MRAISTQVQQVLDRALAHLSEWNTIQQRSESPPPHADRNTLIIDSDEPKT